jgi:hypothetical protein
VNDNPRILIVIGQVLSDPWLSITINGQFPTWLKDAQATGIPVRHSHGRKPGAVTRAVDRGHEWIRWHGRGRSLLPRIDAAIGGPALMWIPTVQVETFLFPDTVGWQQDLVDMYALQRWKVVGSLTQAMKEDFDLIYFTTASSYVNVRVLVDALGELPRTGLYAGTVHQDAISGTHFASGASRVISRDVVAAVLNNRRGYRNDVMEDVGLGRLIADLGFPLTALPSINISSPEALASVTDEQIHSNFHFRMTSGHPGNRQDAPLMLALHERIKRVEAESGVPGD